MVIVYIIIAVTVIISIISFKQRDLFDSLKFNAYYIKHDKQPWRFFTYAFVHADYAHLLINMFVLYSFADVVVAFFSYYFGLKGLFFFVLLYFGGIISSVLVDFGKHKDDIYYNAIGASGAVSAVLFSSILLYPTGSIYMFFIPIPIPSAIFGILYLVYSAYMSKKGKDNIGHNAHFWGAIYGIVFTIALRPAVASEFIDKIMSLLS